MYFHQPSGVEIHWFSEMVFGIFQYISQIYLEIYIRDSVQGYMFKAPKSQLTELTNLKTVGLI